jgi:hypothetical protein
LSTTAILGYGFPEESLEAGLARKPHLIAVDAGSTDPGPYYLGSGKSFTNRDFVKRDLTFMIAAGVRGGIPVVVGSAGGSGAAPHLAWCREIILEIAREQKLSFSMAVIPADIPKALVRRALKEGRIKALAFVPELDEKAVQDSEFIVAQMGVEPLIAAHAAGAQVILAGRCYDPANFAALPIMLGHDPGLALHMGKILECAAIAASPGSGADCALGILKPGSFILESLNPRRRFTGVSTAAHTLYEKSDPYRLPGPGGLIDLHGCSFSELPDGSCEVRGSRFVPSDGYWIKLEGARRIGFRAVSIAGVRDPIMIASIGSILEEARAQVAAMRGDKGAAGVRFHVYGRDGVMGALEPEKTARSHELCIVIDAVGESQAEADMLCSVMRSTLLHYGYAGRISTAGNLAFPFSPSDIAMGAVYEFSLYHIMRVASGAEHFPVALEQVRG